MNVRGAVMTRGSNPRVNYLKDINNIQQRYLCRHQQAVISDRPRLRILKIIGKK